MVLHLVGWFFPANGSTVALCTSRGSRLSSATGARMASSCASVLGLLVCTTLAGLSASVRTASAQTVRADSLLSVPGVSPLRCRATAPSSEDVARGARTHLQIEEVRRLGSGTRDDDVWYDSTGVALWFTETVTTVNSDGGANLDAVTGVRAPDGRFLGYHMRYNGAAVGAKDPVRSRQIAPLSEQEGKAARALIEWFWSHRCRPVNASHDERD